MYIYAADVWCDTCGEAIREDLTQQGKAPADPNEDSYDSDVFPKGPYSEGDEADSVQHCGAGEECLNAIELPNGAKIGAWLENALTEEGIEGVRDAIIGGLARRRGNSHVLSLWAQWYPEVLDGVPLHLDTKTDTFVPVVIVMDEDQADTPSYFRGVQKLVRVELRGEGACLVSEAIGDIAGKSWTCNSRHDAAYVVLPDDAKLEAALANFEVEE